MIELSSVAQVVSLLTGHAFSIKVNIARWLKIKPNVEFMLRIMFSGKTVKFLAACFQETVEHVINQDRCVWCDDTLS